MALEVRICIDTATGQVRVERHGDPEPVIRIRDVLPAGPETRDTAGSSG